MVNLDELIFKKLNYNQFTTLVSWAKEEGWNPGPNDAEVFWKTDTNGFYGVFLADELIGGGAIVKYSNTYGFMGLFIVKPAYRGSGIGNWLWYKRRNTLLARMGGNATIGMDGVVAMQPFYKKGGFDILFKDERYENIGAAMAVSTNVKTIHTTDFDEVVAYDAKNFGCQRAQFLKNWLSIAGNFCFKYVTDNSLQGMVVLRKASEGYKIGPLFANTYEIAEELYKACLNAVPNQKVYLDIPVVNKAAVALVAKYNAVYVFECARMYYGTPPTVNWNTVFGITTFELG